ncbi:fructose-bisphosphate aldolase cytoplasmic isozyme-like [Hibiscus syriacus]|uniref:Fructose-bisphosphate aldolase cytoplasmic isozyme-like n=1 Tax=Hibiscus syriacus TaxID=106335 RepID=A0A6A3A0L3_HIBSY|nr:trihelix transcription factor PTL-like [Hibiscus syriacus]KAE8697814.1 fructose-bisphosphate aldolase cytoplasmic isozyme-like [Hibiscus syriacus]
MEMEIHHPYGMPDLRQLLNERPSHFQTVPQDHELFSSSNRNLPPLQPPHHHQFNMMQMVGRQVGRELMPSGLHHDFLSDGTVNNGTPTAAVAVNSGSTPSPSCRFDGEAIPFGGDGGTGRWPRQETLTLLEIRSRLDPKFKEANQRGLLWDEVSRTMCEDHGYQRSGKKCREKFENLYKYYKKTKEGKAGRQDGKHYRFFRQLEALYGETSNSISGQETQLVANNFLFHATQNCNITQANQDVSHSQKLCDSLSLSNSFEFNPSSSDENGLSTEAGMENGTSSRKKKRGGRCWKAMIKEFIESQMRKLIVRQEAWLENLTKTLEEKEKERVLREEQWRKGEAARIDRENEFWAKERAWIEARDSALMEALQNLTGKQLKGASSSEVVMANEMENQCENLKDTVKVDGWQETEISRLIQLRTTLEGCSEEILWEEIAAKMACLGFEKSASMCKEKWDNIGAYLMKTYKKGKEDTRDHCGYHQNNESLYSETVRLQANDGSSPSNSNADGNCVNDRCFRFLMADGENYWGSYGLKLNKGENQ